MNGVLITETGSDNMNTKTVIACAMLAFGLVGCRGEPSASEVDQAVRLALESTKIIGMKVVSVKKLACRSADENAYLCDVEVTTSNDFTGPMTQTGAFRFVEADDGWRMSQR